MIFLIIKKFYYLDKKFGQLNTNPVLTPVVAGDVPADASTLLPENNQYLYLDGWVIPLGHNHPPRHCSCRQLNL